MCILIDTKNKMLIESKTGETVSPSCFDDLIQYHAYLCGGKYPEEAQRALKRVFKGERIMHDMLVHNMTKHS